MSKLKSLSDALDGVEGLFLTASGHLVATSGLTTDSSTPVVR